MKKLTLVCLLAIVAYGIFGQTTQSDEQTKKLTSYLLNYKKFSANYPQEKVYLHFDNTSYFLGENIWFKAYVVRADRNSLSQMSKILYVELVSAEGYVVDSKKLKIENGQCHGDFRINTTNYGGFYEVRAYTRYMLNFGEQNYFSRVFPVYDKPETEGVYQAKITERSVNLKVPMKRPVDEQKEKINVSFFPEGGNLVEGVSSRLAFKATSKENKNVSLSGGIYNAKNEKVAELESGYLGMGVTQFTPDNSNYIAKFQLNNEEFKFTIPKAIPTGYVMTIDNSDSAEINIQIDKNNMTKPSTLGLSVSCRGILYAFQAVDFENENSISLSVPKNMVPSGVSQITLFNAEGRIESERLVFVNHHSQMKIKVTSTQKSYAPYEPVALNFDLKDKKENPVETSFSVSVRDAGNSPETNCSDNILSNLLLSSELKGYIENPGYYFESESPARKQSLDLLLMTQGWRRYGWQQMTASTPFQIKYWMDKELTMDGSVMSLLQKKPVKDAEVEMVLLQDDSSQQGVCKTDSVGVFNFALKDFYGEASLILQSKKQDKLRETYIRLNRQFSPDFRSYAQAETNPMLELKNNGNLGIVTQEDEDLVTDLIPEGNDKLSMDKRQHLLDAITVKAKKKPIRVSIGYNVEKEMDKMIDKNTWEPSDLGMLLAKTNKYIDYSSCGEGAYRCTYKGKEVIFIRDDSKFLFQGSLENTADLGGGSTSQSATSTPTMMKSESLSQTNPGDLSSNSTTDPNNPNSDANSNTQNTQNSEKKEDNPTTGCVGTSFPDIDQIQSISIIEDQSSIIRLYPDYLTYKKRNHVLAIAHIKKKYLREPVGVRNTSFAGYSYVKEFYQPNYNDALVPKERDFRRTLYWNPDVKTDKDGKATVSFFNSSTCKNINVSAETVTQSGLIGGY